MEQHQKALFEKFLRDECSAEEIELLLAYLQEGKDTALHPLMQEVWQKMSGHPAVSAREKSRQYQQLLHTIQARDTRKSRFYYSLRAAASLTGILLLSIITYRLFFQQQYVEQQTAYGETKEILLPDSSRVFLNSNSSIRYARAWSAEEDREVILEGEAFFEVTHQKNHQKFIVTTSATTRVEVLGTAFNVNNRHAQTAVVLQSGEVQLHAAHTKPQAMQPGEQLIYSEESRQVAKKKVDPTLYSSWKHKQLIFQEATLQEIAGVLKDNYGYDVIFAQHDIKHKQFTGTVATDKIPLLFEMLSKSFNLNIQVQGKTLHISVKK